MVGSFRFFLYRRNVHRRVRPQRTTTVLVLRGSMHAAFLTTVHVSPSRRQSEACRPTEVLQQCARRGGALFPQTGRQPRSFHPPTPTPRAQNSTYFPQTRLPPALYVDVDQHRLPDALDLGDDAFEIERLRENDLEDFLHVY